jgi:hypothetical protein
MCLAPSRALTTTDSDVRRLTCAQHAQVTPFYQLRTSREPVWPRRLRASCHHRLQRPANRARLPASAPRSATFLSVVTTSSIFLLIAASFAPDLPLFVPVEVIESCRAAPLDHGMVIHDRERQISPRVKKARQVNACFSAHGRGHPHQGIAPQIIKRRVPREPSPRHRLTAGKPLTAG